MDVDSTHAVVSRSPPKPGNELLATYRCQGQVTRMEILYRTAEGQAGDIEVFVVASISPKTAKSLHIPVKPLNLHHLTHPVESEDELPLVNTVRITGDFSLQQAHDWVSSIVPDVPSRPPIQQCASVEVVPSTLAANLGGGESCARLWLRNALVESLFIVTYKEGLIVLQSESPSAIVIAKESINYQATDMGMKISTKDSFTSSTLRSIFDKLHPVLEHTLSLSNKVELLDALKVGGCRGFTQLLRRLLLSPLKLVLNTRNCNNLRRNLVFCHLNIKKSLSMEKSK